MANNFCCPFFAHKPLRYWGDTGPCMKGFQTIGVLKQHITEKHMAFHEPCKTKLGRAKSVDNRKIVNVQRWMTSHECRRREWDDGEEMRNPEPMSETQLQSWCNINLQKRDDLGEGGIGAQVSEGSSWSKIYKTLFPEGKGDLNPHSTREQLLSPYLAQYLQEPQTTHNTKTPTSTPTDLDTNIQVSGDKRAAGPISPPCGHTPQRRRLSPGSIPHCIVSTSTSKAHQCSPSPTSGRCAAAAEQLEPKRADIPIDLAETGGWIAGPANTPNAHGDPPAEGDDGGNDVLSNIPPSPEASKPPCQHPQVIQIKDPTSLALEPLTDAVVHALLTLVLTDNLQLTPKQKELKEVLLHKVQFPDAKRGLDSGYVSDMAIPSTPLLTRTKGRIICDTCGDEKKCLCHFTFVFDGE